MARPDAPLGHADKALGRHDVALCRAVFRVARPPGNEFLIHSRKRMVVPVHPRTHNDRLAAQQGTFLCIGDPDASFGENLLGCMSDTVVKDQSVLYRLVVDKSAAPEILARLSTMNIHQASLFPDLQGYARFIADSLVLFGMRSSYYSSLADWESMERLGWLG